MGRRVHAASMSSVSARSPHSVPVHSPPRRSASVSLVESDIARTRDHGEPHRALGQLRRSFSQPRRQRTHFSHLVWQILADVRRAWRYACRRSWPYLLFSGATFAMAWRAWRPARRLQTMATFLACMIPSEFSWHMLAVVAASAWAYFRTQRRLTLPVVVCGGLNTVTAGILAWMGLQSSRAHTVFKAAFRRVGMLTTPATSRPTTWTRAALSVLPLPQMLTRDIEIERSIVYGRVGRKRLKLDLYWHKENLQRPNAPVFMYIHGGGWITGHRFFHSLPLLLHMARNGWLVATINYRLAPRVTMPEQLVDCKRAVAWMKRNAAKFGGNPDFLLVGGESAGGHLSAMVGLTAGDHDIQVGFETDDTSVQGVVDLYGVHDFTDHRGVFHKRDDGAFQQYIEAVVMQRRQSRHPDAFRKASPIHVLQSATNIPPFLIVHGDSDTLVPVDDARHFFSQLRQRRRDLAWRRRQDKLGHEPIGMHAATRTPDVYVELPGAHHAFNFVPSHRTWCLGDAVIDFADHLRQCKAEVGTEDGAQDVGSGAAPASRLPRARL